MALATIADVTRHLDSLPARGTARITIADDGTITEENAQAFLDAQIGYVIARLGFTPAESNLVAEITSKLTAFHIWIHVVDRSQGDGEIPEYVQAWIDWSEKCLTDAKKGDLEIPPLDDDVTPIRAFSSDMRQVVDEPVTMQTSEWVKLASYPIIPKSEIVYSAKVKGGTQYTRGTDYNINYAQNEVFAISGGAIADSQQVYFSYQHLETRLISKNPERVEYANRAVIPDWSGLFGG